MGGILSWESGVGRPVAESGQQRPRIAMAVSASLTGVLANNVQGKFEPKQKK